jgi:hydroxyacylglutathione hydrolase
MILDQYYLECLSHASYLIGDETTKQAIVVDPRRDITEYLDDARRLGLIIVGVVNTHFHADFVSGHLELLEATGAWIGFGRRAETDFPIRRLTHGEHIALGEVDIEILETPGHTWESISLLVREHLGAEPTAVLTGDSLFIGDVGRPDLANLGGRSNTDLARAMYHTIHDILLALPDAVTVMPAHRAGSACGKNLSAELTSTIGQQRRTNPSVQPMSEDAFVALITDGQPAVPGYFPVDADLNRRNRPVLDRGQRIEPISAGHVRAHLAAGGAVLDARSPDVFADAHLRGSINVGADGRFAETAGMVLHVNDQIVLISAPGEAPETAVRLARIGFDNVVGYFPTAADGSPFPKTLADLVQAAPRTKVEEVASRHAAGTITLLDIRNGGEREFGRIDVALHIPLAELTSRLPELPTSRPIVVHCAGGWRSGVAASLLRARGFAEVSDLSGGYAAWEERERYCSTTESRSVCGLSNDPGSVEI